MSHLPIPQSFRNLPTRAAPGAFITYEDFNRLYKWFQKINATSLLYKVWFDITYYFMMSESDGANMFLMQRDSIILHVDHMQRRYVTLKDQQLFSGLSELSDHSGMELRMYEIPDSLRCPVASLLAYMKRTNPAVMCLWQRPRVAIRPIEPDVWYDMFPLGLTRLDKMMAQLSRLAGLSATYRTGHVLNTALRHLELAGLSPRLLQEIKGRRSRRQQQPERDSRGLNDGQRDGLAVTCQKLAQKVLKRKTMAV